MTTKTTEPAGEQPDKKPDFGPILAAALGRSLFPAEGVGQLFAETREFIEREMVPQIAEVEEPGTGVTVLASVSKHGIDPLGSTFFDLARESPRFRRGTAVLTSLDSFIKHVQRFGDAESAVFADDTRTAPKLTAVLDYHAADFDGGAPEAVIRTHGAYRHCKHRSVFGFPLADEWKAWIAADGKPMSMGAFAVFLEDRIGDIALAGDDFPEEVERFVNINGGPAAIADYARLVELSRGLKVYEDAVIEEAQTMSSGEGHLRFSVEHRTAGANGGMVKIPTMFFIAIPVFKKGVFYRIPARLRYRKTPEGVKFWFDLWRADRSFDDAFSEALTRVQTSVPAALFLGAPEA